MTDRVCPGLPANWINAWLAAIGVTTLLPGVKLAWTGGGRPVAILSTGGAPSLDDEIANRIPTSAALSQQAEAVAFPGKQRKQTNKIPLDSFPARAASERRGRTSVLAGSVTDLASADVKNAMEKSAFEPAAPGPTGGVLARVGDCLDKLPKSAADRLAVVTATLDGIGARVRGNGLCFDIRRLPSGVHGGSRVMIDPVVEFLSFTALAHFPVRGDGRRARTRGWFSGKSSPDSFKWPTWSDPLDQWSIDALLDRLDDLRSRAETSTERFQAEARRLGITAVFGVVPYRQQSASDSTRAYGSHRLW